MFLTTPIRVALKSHLQVRDFGGGSKGNLFSLLQNAQLHSLRFLYGAAAMAAILFVVMVFFIVYFREDPTILAGLSAVFGTSITGLIVLVVQMSKSVTQAGILLAMVSQLPDEDILEAIKALLLVDGGSAASGRATRNVG